MSGTVTEAGPDPEVRRAGPDDAAAIGAVQALAWREGYADVLPASALAGVDETLFAQTWHASLSDPPSERHAAFVSTVDGRTVGFVAVGPSADPDADEGTAELFALVVHPRARGAGHGSRLLNAAAEHARRAGFTWLDAWLVVSDENGRRFLGQAGMVPDQARRRRVVGQAGEQVMEVRLGAGLGS